MNKYQSEYKQLKSAYDAAFETQNWELVDKLEDPYIEAEFALVDWMFDEVRKTGKMSDADIDLLRRKSNSEQWNKFIDNALRLAV